MMNDKQFLSAFEDCSLPFVQWSHRAHVRVAYLYASHHDLNSAIDQMREGIRAYNAVHGVEDGPHTGYHETTTRAFMRLIQLAVQEQGPFRDSHDFCNRSPGLLDRRVLLCYYTRDRIMQPDAKIAFVEPDIVRLDRAGLAFPEFGERAEGICYTMRPGGFGVITQSDKRVAVDVTPAGMYLPGGGQEPGESAVAALHREVREACGLTVQILSPIGVADELVFVEQEYQHFCTRCSFYAAIVVAISPVAETDHRLAWLEPNQAIEQLSHASQRWAVCQFLESRNGEETA